MTDELYYKAAIVAMALLSIATASVALNPFKTNQVILAVDAGDVQHGVFKVHGRVDKIRAFYQLAH